MYLMNKAELVTAVAKTAGTTKVKAEMVLNGILETMMKTMKDGEKVSLLGFGTFSVVQRVQKKGRNPQTGKSIVIPAHKAVKFKPGKTLYGRVQ
jgi:DNA-binding protein HU-beta